MNISLFLVMAFLSFFSAGFAHAETISLKRGMSLDTWITWPGEDRFSEPEIIAGFPEWRAIVSDADLESIKAAGFDFVRMPIDPAVFMWPANASKRGALTRGMIEALRRVRAADLKVVVDLHSMPVTPGWKSIGIESFLQDSKNYKAYLDLVIHIGKTLAGEDPAHVAFEPINEPTVDCGDATSGEVQRWPSMVKELHQAARKAAPNLTIVLSGACWGGAWGLSRLDPSTVNDQNIIWSFHSYEPFIFTHQGASWTGGPETHVFGLTYPPDRKQKSEILLQAEASIAKSNASKGRKAQLVKELRYNLGQYLRNGSKDMNEAFARMKKWSKAHAIPPSRIILGEFGAHRLRTPEQDDSARSHYMRDVRERAEKAGYAWSVWAWSGTFGIAKTNEGRAFSPALLSGLGLQPNAP